MSKKSVVLVEDEHLQRKRITDRLERHFPGIEIHSVSTEFQFRAELEEFEKLQPEAFIMDDMLEWAYPDEDAPAEPADVRGRSDCAGVRCARLIESSSALRKTPVILYTLFDRIDVEEEIRSLSWLRYVQKDSVLTSLIDELKSILTLDTD